MHTYMGLFLYIFFFHWCLCLFICQHHALEYCDVMCSMSTLFISTSSPFAFLQKFWNKLVFIIKIILIGSGDCSCCSWSPYLLFGTQLIFFCVWRLLVCEHYFLIYFSLLWALQLTLCLFSVHNSCIFSAGLILK